MPYDDDRQGGAPEDEPSRGTSGPWAVRAGGARRRRGAQIIQVATRCATLDEFVEKFATFAWEGSLVLPAASALPVGTQGRFVVLLRDQSVAMRGPLPRHGGEADAGQLAQPGGQARHDARRAAGDGRSEPRRPQAADRAAQRAGAAADPARAVGDDADRAGASGDRRPAPPRRPPPVAAAGRRAARRGRPAVSPAPPAAAALAPPIPPVKAPPPAPHDQSEPHDDRRRHRADHAADGVPAQPALAAAPRRRRSLPAAPRRRFAAPVDGARRPAAARIPTPPRVETRVPGAPDQLPANPLAEFGADDVESFIDCTLIETDADVPIDVAGASPEESVAVATNVYVRPRQGGAGRWAQSLAKKLPPRFQVPAVRAAPYAPYAAIAVISIVVGVIIGHSRQAHAARAAAPVPVIVQAPNPRRHRRRRPFPSRRWQRGGAEAGAPSSLRPGAEQAARPQRRRGRRSQPRVGRRSPPKPAAAADGAGGGRREAAGGRREAGGGRREAGRAGGASACRDGAARPGDCTARVVTEPKDAKVLWGGAAHRAQPDRRRARPLRSRDGDDRTRALAARHRRRERAGGRRGQASTNGCAGRAPRWPSARHRRARRSASTTSPPARRRSGSMSSASSRCRSARR